MDREISADSRFGIGSRYEVWIDPAWTIGLWTSAIVLFTVNLGELPLRDWDEGIVAQIAREMVKAPFESLVWLYPQDLSGNPYFNKPPLIHWLIALSFRIGGVNEWTARLPGALLTASSVPLLYQVGREIFFQRSAAVLATLVYLTTLPVVRQGRLAMLDGAVECFLLLMLLCVLRSRRDLRWGLGIGLSFGLICLTKGILGILLGVIAVVFMAWDTPRLLTSRYLWFGVALGCVPVGVWYGLQVQKYGEVFVTTHFLNESLNRVSSAVSNNHGRSFFYVWEIIKNGVPWLLFLPQGIRFAWEHRNLSWAKLVLLWSGIYFAVISIMQTKLPWYAMPLYPALALIVGAQLNRMWRPATVPFGIRVPRARIWTGIFAGLAIVAGSGAVYFSTLQPSESDLQLVFLTLAFTLFVTAVLIARQDTQFIAVLIWGTYLTLLVFMMSPHWIWELGEAYPVKPIATQIQKATPIGTRIYTSYPNFRPSLNFYSDRLIVPAPDQAWQQRWREDPQPFILLEPFWLKELPVKQTRVLATTEDWVLVTRNRSPVFRSTTVTLSP